MEVGPLELFRSTSSPSPRYTILAVDDEPAILSLLQLQLSPEFNVRIAHSIDEAKRELAVMPVDIILSDLVLPDGSGIQLLDWASRTFPNTARVLGSGTTKLQDLADAVNCCRVHRLILKPWRAGDLINHLQDVAHGLYLERSHQQLVNELRALNIQLEERVAERTRELETRTQILEKMALTDALTGIPNRQAIELIARKEFLRRTRSPGPIAFGLVDADHFKQINSRYLLSGGDQVLMALGRTLQRTIRATTDAVGRVGGEEFMIVAPNTDTEGAESLAERLRVAVESTEVPHHGSLIHVTISVGFAVADEDTSIGYEELREAAAAALAEAKSRGRNCCVVRSVRVPATAY